MEVFDVIKCFNFGNHSNLYLWTKANIDCLFSLPSSQSNYICDNPFLFLFCFVLFFCQHTIPKQTSLRRNAIIHFKYALQSYYQFNVTGWLKDQGLIIHNLHWTESLSELSRGRFSNLLNGATYQKIITHIVSIWQKSSWNPTTNN